MPTHINTYTDVYSTRADYGVDRELKAQEHAIDDFLPVLAVTCPCRACERVRTSARMHVSERGSERADRMREQDNEGTNVEQVKTDRL